MKAFKFNTLIMLLSIISITHNYAWSAVIVQPPVAYNPPPPKPTASNTVILAPTTTPPITTPTTTMKTQPKFVSNPFSSACKDQTGATDGFYSGSPLDNMVKNKPSDAEELMTKCCHQKDNRTHPNPSVRELYGSQCTSVGYVPSDLSAGRTTWGEGVPPWKTIYEQ
jgi:hypothetical protein